MRFYFKTYLYRRTGWSFKTQKFYGGRHRNGNKPIHHAKGSGSIAREALQQLEKAGFVKNQKTGRIISSTGQAFMDNAANEVNPNLSIQSGTC